MPYLDFNIILNNKNYNVKTSKVNKVSISHHNNKNVKLKYQKLLS